MIYLNNSRDVISKNLLYLDEKNPSNFYVTNTGCTATYDSDNSAMLWTNTQYDAWGSYFQNWSLFDYTLDITKQYTASFEWKLEGKDASLFNWELVSFAGINYVASANLLTNSTLQSNGWYKFTYTFIPANSGRASYFRIITGPTHGLTFRLRWRYLQLEQNSYATNFIANSLNPQSVILKDLMNNKDAVSTTPIYEGLNGGSLYLDGSTSYIDTNNKYLSNYNQGTISIWTKTRDISKVNHYWYEGNGGDGFGGEPETHLTIQSGGNAYMYFSYGGLAYPTGFLVSQWLSPGFAVSNNIWFNTTFTYSFNSTSTSCDLQVYMNGQLNGSATLPDPLRNFTTNSVLGRPSGYSFTTRSLTGSLGQFMFYNRVLSATEILSNYNALKSRHGL